MDNISNSHIVKLISDRGEFITIQNSSPEIVIHELLEAAKRVAEDNDCMDYLGQKCLSFAKDGEFGSP